MEGKYLNQIPQWVPECNENIKVSPIELSKGEHCFFCLKGLELTAPIQNILCD